MTIRLVCIAAAICGIAAPALAADEDWDGGYDAAPAAESTTTDLSIRIGIGGVVQPDWEGSNDYEIVPWPIVSLEYLRLPGIGTVGGRTVGFSIGPSFNFVGERDPSSDPALTGLGTVDSAFEFGLRAIYEVNNWGAYAALRQGFGGHDGLVGEAALYAVWRPTDVFVVRAGPNVTYASADYFDTYFSVTPVQSFRSGLPIYSAGSGFKSAGIQALATYSLTEKVDLHFRAGYDRLVSGAADSPIVTTAGSRDQFSAGLGLSYRIDLDLYD